MSMNKLWAGVALALTGTLGAGVAQAGPVDVQWSIVIGTPVYTQPVPVPVYGPGYGRPRPVYTRPAPVWVPPVAVAVPAYPRRGYLQPTRWDADGDGIPNRHDRLYNPHWDRDGDRVPNRHDRHPGRAGPSR